MPPRAAAIKSVSLVMPTFNEGGHIQDLIAESAKALASTTEDFEIIVVDDNSPDKTWELAERCANAQNKVRVIRRMKDHGLTQSIQEGIDAARCEVISWMDCDFSHPPEKIPQLLYMLNQGYDVAVNSRYCCGGGEDREGKGSAIQLFLSLTLNWGIRFMLRSSFSDYTSGFIAARREVFSSIRLRGDYGEYFIDLIYRAIRKGYHVCELPYMAQPRRSGESKTGSNLGQYLKRGRKYISTVMKLRWEDITGADARVRGA
jgi:dolichol-phosphate mannosyltransferase